MTTLYFQFGMWRILRFVSLVMLLSMMQLTNSYAKTSEAENAVAASCFITDGKGNMLMVEEAFNHNFYLPGGTVEGSETSAEAALRHTYLETKFDVEVNQQLGQIQNHTIFACRVKNPHVFIVDSNQRKIVISWDNLQSAQDVSQPYLLPNDRFTQQQYAYSNQTRYFHRWLTQAAPSKFSQIGSGVEILPEYYRVQHAWLTDVRDWALSIPGINDTIDDLPLIGTLVFPLLFVISLPFIRTFYGFRALLIYSAGLVYLAVICILLNTHLVTPPPFFADHSFKVTNNFWFSLPNNEVTFLSFIFSWIVTRWPRRKQRTYRAMVGLLGVLCVITACIKAAIFGETYPSDLLLSVFLGIGISIALKRLQNWRLANRVRALVSVRFWLYSMFLILFLALTSDAIRIYYLAAFCFGITCSLVALKVTPHFLSTVRKEVRPLFFVASIAGLIGLLFLSRLLTPTATNYGEIVMWNSLLMFLVAVWLMLIIPRIFQRYFAGMLERTHHHPHR